MNESELRDRLFNLAGDAPRGQPAPSGLLRRARRRVLVTIASCIAIGLFLAAMSLAGVRALQATKGIPADDSVLPTPNDVPMEEIALPETAPPNLRLVESDRFSGVHGWIAFRDGPDIVAVDPTEPASTVVLGPAQGQDPIAWSSDGTRLLLRGEIFGGLHATCGSLSPDGTAIVYATGGWTRGPFIVEADGGKPRPLGDACPPSKVEGQMVEVCGEPAPEAAAWSPDGSLIAWLDFGEGTIEGKGHENFVSFVSPDGTGLREGVATLPRTFGGHSLVWSPDGSQLAFWMANDSDRNAQIYVINANGTGLRQITHEGENLWPTWSPDGSQIAFVRDGVLHTVAPDGTGLQAFKGVMPDGAIAWNPLATG